MPYDNVPLGLRTTGGAAMPLPRVPALLPLGARLDRWPRTTGGPATGKEASARLCAGRFCMAGRARLQGQLEAVGVVEAPGQGERRRRRLFVRAVRRVRQQLAWPAPDARARAKMYHQHLRRRTIGGSCHSVLLLAIDQPACDCLPESPMLRHVPSQSRC